MWWENEIYARSLLESLFLKPLAENRGFEQVDVLGFIGEPYIVNETNLNTIFLLKEYICQLKITVNLSDNISLPHMPHLKQLFL